MSETPLVQLVDVNEQFNISKTKIVKAVNGISLDIYKGEILGIVGESGCGKSTLGRVISHIYEPTDGIITYRGKHDVNNLSRQDRTALERTWARQVQTVFQDPHSALNPRRTIGKELVRGLKVHKLHVGKEKERVIELLNMVGLSENDFDKFPHEFSGGQLQRVCIARALSIEPELLICDEPISALDVSIQSQIINLLRKLQKELNLTMIFISHDLSVVRYICDRIAVMYLGKIVELATSDEIYQNPRHFYTKALMSAVPIADPVIEKERQRIVLQGNIPSPINPPSGCSFHERCPYCTNQCIEMVPNLKAVCAKHVVACHNEKEISGGR